MKAKKHISIFKSTTYDTQFEWKCRAQCADARQLPAIPEMGYPAKTSPAFFEAFPENPTTIIRAEGETVEEAERQAWAIYQKFQKCSHEFERGNYTNGCGVCQKCKMVGLYIFEPLPDEETTAAEAEAKEKR